MTSNVELYRGLCEHIPPEAARMIAEALPETDRFTRDLEQLETRLLAAIHGVRAEIQEAKADVFRWMLTFFASLWLGLAGLIVAVVLGG